MVVVVNHLHLTKPIESLRESMDRDALPQLSRLPGFVEAFLVNSDETHGIVIIVWEDRASAENGGKVMGPGWFHDNVAPFLASEQLRSVNEVVARLKAS